MNKLIIIIALAIVVLSSLLVGEEIKYQNQIDSLVRQNRDLKTSNSQLIAAQTVIVDIPLHR